MDAIGNVVMNYNYYSGEDFYSEGASEDMLLDFAMKYSEADFDHIIQNTRSWSVMYHFSHIRENICSWLPIKKSDTVLEIGAGCGAVTGCLANLAGKVTCIDLSKKRSLINANRHRDMDNIEIVVGNFEDIEPEITEKYDYITLVGVFEYAESYINADMPYQEFLRRVSSHLKPDGKLVIAIENKLGLKYFAGCKEDHTGMFFEGIEGYTMTSGVKTFSHNGLEKVLAECGFDSRFYYPYPDYKLPHTIYSDEWLPKTGELNTNIRNFDADRVVTFDEGKVFDTLIEEDRFRDFSNSFLVIATAKQHDNTNKNEDVYPVFVKYANERARDYRIATVIYSDNDRLNWSVKKIALNKESNAHIEEIYTSYLDLCRHYEGTGLAPNKCSIASDESLSVPVENYHADSASRVELEYVSGMTLNTYLDRLEENKEYERMLLLMKEYEAMVYSINEDMFENSEEFINVFGERVEGEYAASKICDLDMIFSNIVFDKDRKENGEWCVLDYEWTFKFPIPAKFIIYRALYYYIEDHRNSAFLNYMSKRGTDLYKEFNISDNEKDMFERLEHNFQVYIIRGVASLNVMHELMPVQTLDLKQAIEAELYLRDLNNPKLYYGCGEGFANDRQLYIFGKVSDDSVSISIPLKAEITELRIDPTEYPCIVKVKKAVLVMSDGSERPADRFLTNGYVGSKTTLLFDTNDSQIQYYKLPAEDKTLVLEYTVSMVEQGFFDELKQMFMERMERDKKELTVMDKVLIKVGKKEVEAIPQGLWYNCEPQEGNA